MIVVRLHGGLGNQMFQYALGRRLSLDRGVPLKLDPGGIFAYPGRPYHLNNLRISIAGIAAPHEWASASVVRDRLFAFDPVVLASPSPAYVVGGWQSERYFDAIADIVRSDFQLVRPMSPRRQEINRQMDEEGTSISLHIRRGDYVSTEEFASRYGSFSPEWYRAAMERITEGVEHPRFFAFSDDPAWMRAHLPSAWPITFVDPSGDGRDYEDMHLMARCRHHVIANSTFSWWGAWLDPDPDKRVVAPARWFNDDTYDFRDVVPAAWFRL